MSNGDSVFKPVLFDKAEIEIERAMDEKMYIFISYVRKLVLFYVCILEKTEVGGAHLWDRQPWDWKWRESKGQGLGNSVFRDSGGG